MNVSTSTMYDAAERYQAFTAMPDRWVAHFTTHEGDRESTPVIGFVLNGVGEIRAAVMDDETGTVYTVDAWAHCYGGAVARVLPVGLTPTDADWALAGQLQAVTA